MKLFVFVALALALASASPLEGYLSQHDVNTRVQIVQQWQQELKALTSFHRASHAELATHARAAADHAAVSSPHQAKDLTGACLDAVNELTAAVTTGSLANCAADAAKTLAINTDAAVRATAVQDFCSACPEGLRPLVKKTFQACNQGERGDVPKLIRNVATWLRSICQSENQNGSGSRCISKFWDAIAELQRTSFEQWTQESLNGVCGKCVSRFLRDLADDSTVIGTTALNLARKNLRTFCLKGRGKFCLIEFRGITARVEAALKKMLEKLQNFNPNSGSIPDVSPEINEISEAFCSPCVQKAIRNFAVNNINNPVAGAAAGFASFFTFPICRKDGGEWCLTKIFKGSAQIFSTIQTFTASITEPPCKTTCDERCEQLAKAFQDMGCCGRAILNMVPSNAELDQLLEVMGTCPGGIPGECSFCARNYVVNATISNYFCQGFEAARAGVKRRVCSDMQSFFATPLDCSDFAATCDAANNKLTFEVKGPFCSTEAVPEADITTAMQNGTGLLNTEEAVPLEDPSVRASTIVNRAGSASALTVSIAVAALAVFGTIMAL